MSYISSQIHVILKLESLFSGVLNPDSGSYESSSLEPDNSVMQPEHSRNLVTMESSGETWKYFSKEFSGIKWSFVYLKVNSWLKKNGSKISHNPNKYLASKESWESKQQKTIEYLHALINHL